MKYVREHAPEILIIAGIAIFCIAFGNFAMATEKPLHTSVVRK